MRTVCRFSEEYRGILWVVNRVIEDWAAGVFLFVGAPDRGPPVKGLTLQAKTFSDTYSQEVGTWFEGIGFLGCHSREKGGMGEGLLVDVAGLGWAEYGMYTTVHILR